MHIILKTKMHIYRCACTRAHTHKILSKQRFLYFIERNFVHNDIQLSLVVEAVCQYKKINIFSALTHIY